MRLIISLKFPDVIVKMKKSQLRNIIKESIKKLMNEQTSCDNSMAGTCAQTHLKPNYNWPNMTNFACTAPHRFQSLMNNQSAQITALFTPCMFNQVNTNYQVIIAYQDHTWSGTSNWVNMVQQACPNDVSNQVRGQIKRKVSKYRWAECMKAECNC